MSRVFALAPRPGLKKIPPSTGGASLAICWVFFFFFAFTFPVVVLSHSSGSGKFFD